MARRFFLHRTNTYRKSQGYNAVPPSVTYPINDVLDTMIISTFQNKVPVEKNLLVPAPPPEPAVIPIVETVAEILSPPPEPAVIPIVETVAEILSPPPEPAVIPIVETVAEILSPPPEPAVIPIVETVAEILSPPPEPAVTPVVENFPVMESSPKNFLNTRYTSMATPPPTMYVHNNPCCAPATAEGVAAVSDKVADARADTLTGQALLQKASGDATTAILQDANVNSSAAASRMCSDTASIIAAGQRGDIHTQDKVDRFGLAGISATRDAVNHVNNTTDSSLKFLHGAVSDSFARQLAASFENTKEILHLGRDTALQSATNFGAIQLEAAKNTAAIQLQAATNQKESLLEQSKWFAAADRTALMNKCELADKFAECCCEIKSMVQGTARDTQQLIVAQETSRIRDALAAATNENLFLRLRTGGGNGNGN